MGAVSALHDGDVIEKIKLEKRLLEVTKEKDYYKSIVTLFISSLGAEVHNEFVRKVIEDGKGRLLASKLVECAYRESLEAIRNCKDCQFSQRR